MQTNSGFIEHVTHALQVAAKLRREPDALRFAATQGRCTTVQREVAQAHLFEKQQAAADLGHQVARNIGLASAQTPRHLQGLDPFAGIGHAQTRKLGDTNTAQGTGRIGPRIAGRHKPGYSFCLRAKPYRPRHRVEPRTLAAWAGVQRQVFHLHFGKRLLATVAVVVAHRIVERLALLLGQAHTGAHTVRAPAVFAVVRKKARIELRVAGAADRAGTFGGKHLQLAHGGGWRAGQHRGTQTGQVAQHMHHAFAMHQRTGQQLA